MLVSHNILIIGINIKLAKNLNFTKNEYELGQYGHINGCSCILIVTELDNMGGAKLKGLIAEYFYPQISPFTIFSLISILSVPYR